MAWAEIPAFAGMTGGASVGLDWGLDAGVCVPRHDRDGVDRDPGIRRDDRLGLACGDARPSVAAVLRRRHPGIWLAAGVQIVPDPGIRRDDRLGLAWWDAGRSVAAVLRRVIPGLTRDLASALRPVRPRSRHSPG